MRVDIRSKIPLSAMKAGQVFRDGNQYWLVTDMTAADRPDTRLCVEVETGACYYYTHASQFETVDTKMVLTT